MCINLKILNQTKSGMLLFCAKNEFFQLSFNNLMFNLTGTEIYALSAYLDHVDCDYWEHEYKNSVYEKRIPLPTLQSNLVILLSKPEVRELLMLLDYSQQDKILQYYEIENLVFLN